MSLAQSLLQVFARISLELVPLSVGKQAGSYLSQATRIVNIGTASAILKEEKEFG